PHRAVARLPVRHSSWRPAGRAPSLRASQRLRAPPPQQRPGSTRSLRGPVRAVRPVLRRLPAGPQPPIVSPALAPQGSDLANIDMRDFVLLESVPTDSAPLEIVLAEPQAWERIRLRTQLLPWRQRKRIAEQ